MKTHTTWVYSCVHSKKNLLFVCGTLLLLLISGCYEKPQPRGEEPPVPVRLGKVVKKDVQNYRYFSGTTYTEPINIVPRVRGYLEAISFLPGDIVEKDAPLFKLEQFDYVNDVEEAAAGVAIAEANAAKAKADYDRELTLKQKGEGFTTQADIDRTKAQWNEATAQIASKKANLAEAHKQLERTIIKAPMRGKISRNLVEKGNLVDGTGSNPQTLATLMAMDPMYVYFQVTDRDFIFVQNRIYEELRRKLGDRFKEIEVLDNKALIEVAKKEQAEELILCRMQLLGASSGERSNEFPYEGFIDYNDNVIDVSTGTNTLRARFANPNYRLYPGTLCRVRLEAGLVKGALVIDEKGVCTDLSTKYVWVLDEKGTTQKREIVLGKLSETGERLVVSGLKEGESYVIDGTQKVRMGSKITEVKGTAEPNAAADHKTAGALSSGSPEKKDVAPSSASSDNPTGKKATEEKKTGDNGTTAVKPAQEVKSELRAPRLPQETQLGVPANHSVPPKAAPASTKPSGSPTGLPGNASPVPQAQPVSAH